MVLSAHNGNTGKVDDWGYPTSLAGRSRSRSRRRNDDDVIVGQPRDRSTSGHAHGSLGTSNGRATANLADAEVNAQPWTDS
jgi:hypothetical protein